MAAPSNFDSAGVIDYLDRFHSFAQQDNAEFRKVGLPMRRKSQPVQEREFTVEDRTYVVSFVESAVHTDKEDAVTTFEEIVGQVANAALFRKTHSLPEDAEIHRFKATKIEEKGDQRMFYQRIAYVWEKSQQNAES